MKERSEGFVREEIKRIDEQLQRNLSLRSMQKQKLDDKGMQKQQNLGDKGMQKQQNLEDNEKKKVRFTEKQDWEIDPSKLIIKQVIAPGAFGTVHRGIYDGQDVAGNYNFYAFLSLYVFTSTFSIQIPCFCFS